jgi:hypothetical protein
MLYKVEKAVLKLNKLFFYKKPRAAGLEPTTLILKTNVLPLNYASKMAGEGFEPSI